MFQQKMRRVDRRRKIAELIFCFVIVFAFYGHSSAEPAIPYLVDTNVIADTGICLVNNVVVYPKGGNSTTGKRLNPEDLSEQDYLMDSATGQRLSQGYYNHYDFDMRPGGEGYLVYSGSNEHMFYRKVYSNFQVGPVQYITYESFHNWVPKVYGNNIVWWWSPGPYQHWDIKLQNLQTGSRTTLAGGAGDQWSFDIDKNYVLYRDINSLYVINITSSDPPIPMVAVDGSPINGNGYIQGNRVMIQTGGAQRVYLYEIGVDPYASLILQETSSDIKEPYLFDDLLVWADDRNGTYDLYGLNLTDENATPFQITDNGNTDERHPVLENGIIVWVQGPPGFGYSSPAEIYAAKIGGLPEIEVDPPEYDYGKVQVEGESNAIISRP